MKITVIGAGAVGATMVLNLAQQGIVSDIGIIDIQQSMTDGKVLDMEQASFLLGFATRIRNYGTDYTATKGTDIAIITSGIPRKPGMTRDELISTNASIVTESAQKILSYSPDATFIIITNPMDTLTYLTMKKLSLPKNRVIGMGGILDTARFRTYLSLASGITQTDIQAMVIGGHGDTTMIPLWRLAQVQGGIPFTDILSKEVLDKVVADTMIGGATLTKLLGTSSWYAPGAAVAALVKAFVLDEKKIYACSVYLEGEFGQKDICIGVPAVIGRNGVEKIIELPLNEEEKEQFRASADAVRAMNLVGESILG